MHSFGQVSLVRKVVLYKACFLSLLSVRALVGSLQKSKTNMQETVTVRKEEGFV